MWNARHTREQEIQGTTLQSLGKRKSFQKQNRKSGTRVY